ncbi:hypothetical protein QBC34DRAFT_416848 [Podospora aff. communis PSN243]|uniref:Steroid 5-alpha reductase C-terminal domain-containing protein n=1 Tax=Podospora aff. communis PSN243 TaxID=3040156 RepID=A0AAV9G688_9PEZI|nr:hypothetical protein QBC34DRAFT_416848 [Podospora aff. communis PSN243]
MSLLQSLLRLTNFRSPLLRTIVPSVSAAFAIQAAFAIPSIIAQSDRFYDFSGSVTYLAVTALSLYLPALRARAAGSTLPLPGLLEAFKNGGGALNWRQVLLSGCAGVWAARLGSYLFQRVLQEGKDSRFDKIKTSPPRFLVAFMVQAMWVSLCLMPVMAVNAIPAAAFGTGLKLTDVLGLGLYVGGLGFEVVADRQKSKWMKEKREKQHDEEFLTRGLWSKSRHPNYFGESTLWTGIATASAGVLLSRPVQGALALSPLTAISLCAVSPAFVTFLLFKVSGIPLSEEKYDKKFGNRKDFQEWKKNTPKFFPKLF